MDAEKILALFDRNIRRNPSATNGSVVEREPGIVRVVSASDGWHGISWCDLDGLDADAVIAAQIQRFGRLGQPWEWKHYSHDRPADLPERLLAAGFEPDPVEGLLFAEIADLAGRPDLPLDVRLPAGTRLEAVTDAAGVDLVVAVHDEVFGGDHSRIGKDLTARLAERPGSIAAAVVMAGDRPICAGRIEFHGGTGFASLWGGGTVADWRGRGVFRALVAHRAALAAAAGYRYLQVDASADSRPILRRLGFQQLATTTPFVRNP
ncbi:GNAT family N-acetyltransferase [Dactylosporangium cerinum]